MSTVLDSLVAQARSPLSAGASLGALLPLVLSMQMGGAPSSKATSDPAQVPGNLKGIEAKAYEMATGRFGYSPQDWRKLDYIIDEAPNAESHWNPKALNPDSGAAGIAQKITGWSGNYQPNNPMAQLRWLFEYLENHNYAGYGTGIDAAYAHKKATGWY